MCSWVLSPTVPPVYSLWEHLTYDLPTYLRGQCSIFSTLVCSVCSGVIGGCVLMFPLLSLKEYSEDKRKEGRREWMRKCYPFVYGGVKSWTWTCRPPPLPFFGIPAYQLDWLPSTPYTPPTTFFYHHSALYLKSLHSACPSHACLPYSPLPAFLPISLPYTACPTPYSDHL